MARYVCQQCNKPYEGMTTSKRCSEVCEFMWNSGSHLKHPKGCWEWQGPLAHGYGILRFRGDRSERAHRASLRLLKGDDPGDLWVCHTCDNKRCVNPKHLYIGTVQDNVRDAVKRGQTPRGMGHHKNKLTEEQVDLIIATTKEYGSGAKLARRFNVSGAAISAIRKGKNWKHHKRQSAR